MSNYCLFYIDKVLCKLSRIVDARNIVFKHVFTRTLIYMLPNIAKIAFSRQIRLKTPVAMKWWKNEKNEIDVYLGRKTSYKILCKLF